MNTEFTKIIKKNNFVMFGILIGCNSNSEMKAVSEHKTVKNIIQSENCNCEENKELKDYISCKETVFRNGAKIYRQFNCDSSWLVFENKKIKKNIYSL
jgi:hypothetical protein